MNIGDNINSFYFVKHAFKNQNFKKHFHHNYSIGLITKGTHKLELEYDQLIVKKGKIKIINPYEIHLADGNIGWEYLNFMPNEKIIKTIAEEMCDDTVNCTIKFNNNIEDNNATQYFIKLYNSLHRGIEYQENFIILVSYLLKYYSFNELKIKQISSSIQKSIDYIHNYYLENISLDILANISSLSKYHFIKVFTKKTKFTPHQYIINLRLEYAIKLIKKNIPLAQISLSCGFSDQSHFIRTFKKYYGLTPSNLI